MSISKEGPGDDEAISPNSLIPVHRLSRPDRFYDMQLARDLAIANERTLRELGPPPPGGVPVEPKRKPKLRQPQVPETTVAQNSDEDALMKFKNVAVAAALGATVLASPNAQTSDAMSVDDVPYASSAEPVWPDNGVAERELVDVGNSGPETMFVEYDKGAWRAWILSSNSRGPIRALDFFSGEVMENVQVKHPGGFNDSFVDARGVRHQNNTSLNFHYKDPRPGGALGNDEIVVFLNDDILKVCDQRSLDLDVSRAVESGEKVASWRKIPLYKNREFGTWSSLVNTALDLRDGTMLITASSYIFRVRLKDMSTVGNAPHLKVLDASDVEDLIRLGQGGCVEDFETNLAKKFCSP